MEKQSKNIGNGEFGSLTFHLFLLLATAHRVGWLFGRACQPRVVGETWRVFLSAQQSWGTSHQLLRRPPAVPDRVITTASILLLLVVFAFLPASQAQATGNNRASKQGSSVNAPLANSAQDGAAVPSTGGIPLTLFSMHVQSELFSGMPWPIISFGSMRLWDTYTTWNDLNPSPRTFNWPALDRWLEAAQQHGVDVIYTFGATPTWASSRPTAKCDYNPGACYPPAHIDDWDNFVRAIATHAGDRIKYWEMWNEANQHEYWSGGIPALATMTQHASAIIKSISPGAMIFTPSGVGGRVDTSAFLNEFFGAGGGAFVDGVAFHGYVNSIPARAEDVNGIVDAVQSVMVAHGQGSKPLWDTEGLVGATLTAPCSVSTESTWTCNLTLAGGASAQILWNSAVNIPKTISFVPASHFTQCTDLDGRVTQLSGGPLRVGGKPVPFNRPASVKSETLAN
jgi:hypothetical protein